MHQHKLFWIICLFLLSACQSDPNPNNSTPTLQNVAPSGPQFHLLSPQQSGLQFTNTVKESKEFHHLLWESVYYGGGVAVGDLNNDGLPDLYFTGNQVNDALYLNQGKLKFKDISQKAGIDQKAGWSTGVTMVDINADGWLDIYVCRSWWDLDNNNVDGRRNLLWINNHDLTFTEKAAEYGLDDPAYSTQATFLDYDQDGDLDMYLMNAPSNNFQQKLKYQQQNKIPYALSDHFYENMGKNKFRDRTKKVGIENYAFGLGLMASDINQDGWTDIYVACDYEKPDLLFLNNRDGSFRNQSGATLKHTSYSSMGCDLADFNNDCLLEIAVLDMQAADHKRAKMNMRAMNAKTFWKNVDQGYGFQYMSNALQLNNGWGFFSEIGQMAGLASTDWSWSLLMNDFDNDGHKDVFITNGINKDIRNSDLIEQMKNRPQGQKSQDQLYDLAMQFPSEKIPNYMYQNDGQLHLKEVTKNWGLSQPGYSFGAAYADLDLDGDLELIVCNSNEAVHLFENKNPGNNNFLQVAIKGNRINPRGLGTKVIVYLGDQKLYQELTYTRGYQSSSSEVLHFGLGSANIVDSIAVIFPDKKVYKNQNIKANQQLKVDHHLANHPYRPLAGTPPIFGESTKANHLNFQHLENNFDDFAREILLPHRQSRNGPFISSGDVNQDGFTDFFIGNASGQAGQLFLQKANGQFENAPPRAWKKEAPSEDMGSLFFDADGDEDLDLYVASGGSQFAQNSPLYQDRLYLNNGQGVFQKNPKALPKLYSNSSCVRSADFDRDGDLDLFIGGRGLAGKYPHPGRSQLLVNNKGNFKEQSKALAPELSNIGMVTDAVWADYNQDGWTDLIVVGEWMQPTFFKNNEGQLSQDAQALAAALRGWWFHIEASDLDSDGDLDFVVGNMGTNHKYKASDQKPLLVYSNDFDQNNTNDIVLAKNSDYGVVPVRGRECSSEQMPFIANKFKTYQSFANASLDDIYGEELQQSLSYEATDFRSGWLENKKGRFTFHAFPNLAQIAPIMGTVIKDFNDDGQVDVLVAGNHFDAEVETVRHDAGNGLLLLGQTDQTFVPKTFIESGFYAPLNVKDLAFLPSAQKDRALVIVANNNQTLRCFTFKNKTSTTNKPSQ